LQLPFMADAMFRAPARGRRFFGQTPRLARGGTAARNRAEPRACCKNSCSTNLPPAGTCTHTAIFSPEFSAKSVLAQPI
jgi:hypothetical protein